MERKENSIRLQTDSSKKTLKTFHSFEEMNEADARDKANLSPIEHLKNVTSLIEKLYADELKKPMDKKIKFRQ